MAHTTDLTAELNEYSSNGNWDIIDPDHNIVGKAHGAPWNPAQDAEANARLWAASGDLLSVCQAVEWVEIPGNGFMLIDVCPWCDARKENGHADGCARQAAIAKARGGQCAS